MANTELLIGVAVVVAAVIICGIILFAVCMRRKPQETEEYALLLSEKGNVMPRVNPEIERHHKLEQALMNARFYLRSSSFLLDKYLPDIGQRGQKQYFQVTRARLDYIMSMTRKADKWPIPFDTEASRAMFSKLLKSLEGHPNVSVPLESDYMIEKDLAVSIRPCYQKGSLKDFINKARPQQKYTEKYRNTYSLNPKLIGKFGRQILEGLKFLKFQGFPYYHLHSGNVLVDENTCCLSEMENALVGASPYLSSMMKPLMDKVDPDVVCFGCVLYEMSTGYELKTIESYQLGLPEQCPEEAKKVLDSIFNPWFGTPPTVEELLNMSLFSDVKLKKLDYQRVTYGSKEKELLAAVRKCMVAVITNATIDLTEFQKKKKPKQFTSFSNPSSSIPPLAPSLSSSALTQSPLSSSSTPISSPIASPPPPPPSASAPKPPPPPAKAAPPPPPPPQASSAPSAAPVRNALLDSITGFKGGLKKTVTNDKSTAKAGKVK